MLLFIINVFVFNYSGIRLLFSTEDQDTLQVELGPWGHYFISFINPNGRMIRGGSLDLDYFVADRQDRSTKERKVTIFY